MTEPALLFESSRAALGAPDALAAAQSISAYADCEGPNGAYKTEIHSTRDGCVRFQQTFAGRNPYCIIINANGAWATDIVTGETDALDAVSVSMIRGHEFQMLPLTLTERYIQPELADTVEWNDEACLRVRARDDLGLPCAHYFQKNTERWVGMELTHSRQPGAQVRVVVHAWQTIENLTLPVRVSATDPQGKYIFHFHTVLLNHAAPEIFVQPRAIVREAHAM